MKKLAMLFLVLTFLPFHAPAAAAEKAAPMEKKMTCRFQSITLPKFFAYVSRETGLNFRIDPAVSEMRLTLFARKFTAAEVMELLRIAKELEFRREADGGYFVTKGARLSFPPFTRKDLEDPLLQRMTTNIRLKEAPLTVLLDIVSASARVNFFVTEEAAKAKITVELTKTTVADILQFLRRAGYEYARVGATSTIVVRKAGPDAGIFFEAEEAFNTKKYERAAVIYKEIAADDPESDMADYALLMSAVSYDWLAARENSLQAMKTEEELLERLIKTYPGSQRLGDAYLYLGQIHSGFGGAKAGPVDCPKAIGFYELAIRNTYRDWVKAQALARIAQCHERAGGKEKAAAVYKEIQEKYPDTPAAKELRALAAERDPLLEAGLALERAKEYELAIQTYKRLIARGDPAEAVREARTRLEACRMALEGK